MPWRPGPDHRRWAAAGAQWPVSSKDDCRRVHPFVCSGRPRFADQSRSLGFERVEGVTSAEVRYPKVLLFYENHDGIPAKMKLEVNTHLAPSRYVRHSSTRREDS